MLSLTPFLIFEGNCAEVMTFYQSCLGGELTITKVSSTPMKDRMPAGKHNKVAYARLKSEAIEFSATDWLHPTRLPKQGNTVAMYIHAGEYKELKGIFDKLADGANKELLDDLRDMPFGSYGHLADKFGIHWFFQSEARTP
jgi:PhnB protein